MGPEAALEFCGRLLARTPGVRGEQDHVRVILDNNPKIPDRSAAIQGKGPSPVPVARRGARMLEHAGAAFIAIPCNTVHRWYNEIASAVRVPVIHLIETTVEAARARARGGRRIGFMATQGCMKSGLYQEALRRRGLEPVVPDAREQNSVMAAIQDIKLGRRREAARRTVQRVGQHLARRGARVVILGCTEVSLALRDGDLSVPVMDSLDALVDETLKRACGSRTT